nr:nucleolin-like [Aegilops tauschii subsp. strangulata]
MSDNSDSQNKSEEQMNISEGTSPSNSSYDEGNRSTPSNLSKAATRQRKKRTLESEDEDFVVDEEVTSKKKMLKKEQAATASIKPGMHKKAPSQRKPMSKARASTLETMKSTEEEVAGGKERKERVKKSMARVIAKPSMMRESDEDDEEEEEPVPKSQKLMGDAIKSGAASSKPKTSTKPSAQAQAPKSTAPKRSTRNIPAAKKNKALVPEVQEDEEHQVLKKLKPKILDHDDNHPVAENMKVRNDVGLRLWRQADPCAVRRRTIVD